MQQSTYCALLETALSADRLSTYRQTPQETREDIVARYLWNMEFGKSLYPPLKSLEVTLRNSIHDAATAAFGTPLWFDATRTNGLPVLEPYEINSILAARRELATLQKASSASAIIAQLNFSFWTSLFRPVYDKVLWPQLLLAVFPHAPRKMRDRKKLFLRLKGVRLLRNRVFHYEPIWNRKNLWQVYSDSVETIGWISPASQHLCAILDQFPTVFHAGEIPFRAQLQTLLDQLPP